MDQDRNQEPGKRFRTILSNPDDETNGQPEPQNQPQPSSPLSRLPQLKPSPQPAPLPDKREIAPQASRHPSPPAPSPGSSGQAVLEGRARSSNEGRVSREFKFGPAFWTITGILSLVVNVVLIAVLLVLYNRLDQLQDLQGTASNIGASVLGGMYSNFEKMDRATIKTVIPVDAQIPLDITVPVQTTTQITLAESVSIPNAQVVINTGGLNINSNARVTLPAGTPMLVNLNFSLPVQTTIPVHLDVPVNIPMAETELHEPFVGLQEVVRPWYCMVEPGALSLTGQAICR